MKRVPYEEMVAQFARVLEKKGFTASDAQDAAIIFAQNSLAGVFSHGLNRFPRVVSYLEKGEIDPAARATCVSSMGSIERWDGHRGFGPLNAKRAMDRACELAKQNGVGVVALGFGGGLGGAVVASRAGLTGNQVVVQQVERSTDATAAGSTDGTSMSVQQIASVVSPSVVAITTEQMSSSQTWFGGYYVQSGAGSGVIISQDGYILTCAHVVSGATSVKVQLNGSDESYDATVVGQDSTSDIAVLKIDATGLTPAVIGDSDALAVGEVAVAVGNPLGTLSNTVTDGIVSALNRQVTVQNNDMTLIQTDASISPGNSGGGLFNANGELIGIVNAKSSYSEAEGIGFAIPINTAMEIGRQLIENGSVARPALGVKIVDVTDAQTAQQLGVSTMGVYVVEVTKGSGADAAGVQAGDRVLAVDDTAVSDSSALKNYLKDKGIGDTVNLQVERDGKVLTLAVTLGSSAQRMYSIFLRYSLPDVTGCVNIWSIMACNP